MKTYFLLICAAVAGFLILLPRAVEGAGGPPELLSYQGYLVDADGTPLGVDQAGDPLPSNYDVIFSIFTGSAGEDLKWREQQTITVDSGYFSVVLGEGTAVGSDPRPDLSTAFTGIGASERFIGVSVRFHAGGEFTEILPRLQLLTSPYSFFATSASQLVNQNGMSLITADGEDVYVHGSLKADTVTGDGASLTNLQATSMTGTLEEANIPKLPADRISSGTFEADRIPNLDASKITSGKLGIARIPDLSAEKITSGTLGQDRLSGEYDIVAAQAKRVRASSDQLTQTRAPGFYGPGLYLEKKRGDTMNNPAEARAGDYISVLTMRSTSGSDYSPPVIQLAFNPDHGPNRLVFRSGNASGWSSWNFSRWESSDRRLKKDIVDAEPVLDRAMQVQVRRYRWLNDEADAKHNIGVVAQELQPLFPEAVREGHDLSQNTRLEVEYGDLTLIALKALQELKYQHDEEVAALRDEVAELREAVALLLEAQNN